MKRIYVSIFTFLVVAAGCGDNALDNSPIDDGPSGPSIAVAVAPSADYTAPGILSKLDVTQLTTQTNLGAGLVSGDPLLRRIGDTVYIINRNVNNVTMLDAHTLSYVDQIATGDGSNPQDVAVVGDKLFIPALGTDGVVVGMRGAEPTVIDLQAALGCTTPCKPYCESAYAIGNDVYVACGLFMFTEASKFGSPADQGKVAVIDATSHAVRAVVDLPVANPYNHFVQTPATSAFAGDLLISTLDPDTYTRSDIVRVSPGASPSASIAIPRSDLQSAVSHIEVLEENPPLLLLATAPEYGRGQLRVFDLETEQLWTSPLSPAAQNITDVAACPDGKVVVGDAPPIGEKSPIDRGLRVYSSAGVELTSTALSIGLPPGTGNQLVCYTPD